MCDTGGMEWNEKCHYPSDYMSAYVSAEVHILREWLIQRNLATILPLTSKLSENFQRSNAVDGSNSWIEF